MIRWQDYIMGFVLGCVAGIAAVYCWRRARPSAPESEASPDDDMPPPLPRHDDPRWQQVPCPDGDVSCEMLWLRLGEAMAGVGPNTVRLLSGDYDVGNQPGADRYVEAVHEVWRARRSGLN